MNDFAFVELNLSESDTIEMEIVDMTSRALRNDYLGLVDVGTQAFEVDFSEMPMGMYTFHLVSKDGVASHKFIKK